MRKLWSALKSVIENGDDAVLVTVTASSGSVPRGAGAHMIVTESGRLAGTIGGGAVENEAINRARQYLEHDISENYFYRLYENDVADLGMVCGGNVNVFFRSLKGNNQELIQLLDEIENRYAKNEPTWLKMDITDGEPGEMSICGRNEEALIGTATSEMNGAFGNKPEIIESDGRQYYIEKIVQGGKVYIFGGGHVAQQLARVLTYVNFRCVVVEERAEFAEPELFGPGVETELVGDIGNCRIFDAISSDDYVCIMTRGHLNDYKAQKEALKTQACYIGVIGSRKKIAATNRMLIEDGYTQTDIDRLTRPIGLAIKAETPEEIAISIAAQLIEKRAVRNGLRK